VSLDEFILYAEQARQLIPRGKVDWSSSPFAWMRHHGPRTKSKLGRDIVREWLKTRPLSWADSEDGVSHFTIDGRTVVVHLALLGKEGLLEFANLREPGLGVDALMLVGVEPERARIWWLRPEDVRGFHSYVNDAPGYHNVSIDPDEPPDWLTERARWDTNGDDPQGSLFRDSP